MSTTFIKAQASSIISTTLDFLITYVCKEFLVLGVVAASFTGTFFGGVTNFALGRHWVFDGRDKKSPAQIVKYLIIWCGNLYLTTYGVYLMTRYFDINYLISKAIVAVIVGVGYNYTLQKKFVFA